MTYPYDTALYGVALTSGFATGSVPTFAVIGFENKVYFDSTQILPETVDDMVTRLTTALNLAIDEFPRDGVYINSRIDTRYYTAGDTEDIDVSNLFGEFNDLDITLTLEGNSDPSLVSAVLNGTTLSLEALGSGSTPAVITLKGESSYNFKTFDLNAYSNDPTAFLGMNQGFEETLFPPPYWEIKYNTAADGGLNGASLIDPDPLEEAWFDNTPSDDYLGSDYIHSGNNSAAIKYWAPEFNWLISPEMQLDYDDYFLKFFIWYDNSYETIFHVLVDDGTKGWISILDYDGSSPNNHFDSEVELSLSAYHNQTIRIAFVHEYNDGMDVALDDITITSPTGIETQATPNTISLVQNYPNPFNPNTLISFSLVKNSNVKLNVYNQNGQLVSTLINKEMGSGHHSVNFNAFGLSAGIYYYTLTTDKNSISKKMILLK
ncbi:MAG: T9SS type A sorting domain-containing protein [Candidatus Delongbacteria bacterium]|nr:T9SS type A sorting domain-containing protein [Candidatus Delongbacteria bacterium]